MAAQTVTTPRSHADGSRRLTDSELEAAALDRLRRKAEKEGDVDFIIRSLSISQQRLCQHALLLHACIVCHDNHAMLKV